MKIPVYDIQHIINQIKCASPPVTKEMHKIMNNLSILLEKNIEKRDSPQEAILTGQLERLNEIFLDLCFLRKEIVKKYGEEYAGIVNKALEALESNWHRISSENSIRAELITWDLDTECDDTCQMIPDIFSKLKKAKTVIEDAIEGTASHSLSADSCLDNYISGL